jgi:hypothetical protein
VSIGPQIQGYSCSEQKQDSKSSNYSPLRYADENLAVVPDSGTRPYKKAARYGSVIGVSKAGRIKKYKLNTIFTDIQLDNSKRPKLRKPSLYENI